MVHTGRLSWLYAQLQSGRQARFSFNSRSGGLSLHIKLAPVNEQGAENAFLLQIVQNLMQACGHYCVVDHGHKRSNGCTHISFAFTTHPEIAEAQRVDDVSSANPPAVDVAESSCQWASSQVAPKDVEKLQGIAKQLITTMDNVMAVLDANFRGQSAMVAASARDGADETTATTTMDVHSDPNAVSDDVLIDQITALLVGGNLETCSLEEIRRKLESRLPLPAMSPDDHKDRIMRLVKKACALVPRSSAG